MSIGYCEGLCGGLLSHHLVDGLCPTCRENPAIREQREEVPLGAEADVRHVITTGQDQSGYPVRTRFRG